VSDPKLDEMYRAGRARMLALGATLTDEQAATTVPGCPLWTVKDVYAHQAGVCADVLSGNVEGATTDPWTQAQVDARAGNSLAEVIAEWEASAPAFDAVLEQLRGVGGNVDKLPVDSWIHEQDVRGALDLPGSRDEPVVGWGLDRVIRGFDVGARSHEMPAVRIAGSSEEWTVGEGEPVATLRGSDFELLRAFIGRRSRAQVLAMFDGDGEPFVDRLVVFAHSTADIVE
jgi:uncharacterized protein (TIGR03083 family)